MNLDGEDESEEDVDFIKIYVTDFPSLEMSVSQADAWL